MRVFASGIYLKTTLSTKISNGLCIPRIELDDFVKENQGGYINFIDYKGLSDKIVSKKPVIVEGICVLQILNKIQVKPDVSIYINVVDRYGFCNAQIRYFPPDKTAEEVINERIRKGYSVGYEADIIRYHYSFMPHENADFIFQRQT